MSEVREVMMSRILEGVFVLGCSLVGLAMSAPEGSVFQNTVKSSIQLVALAQNNVTANTCRLGANLSRLPVVILGNWR
jgi:hypothetical protein